MVMTVAQWAKAPGIRCYVAGSIPAVTPEYCIIKIKNALRSAKKLLQKLSACHLSAICYLKALRVPQTAVQYELSAITIVLYISFNQLLTSSISTDFSCAFTDGVKK